jgi:hypothetical protein
VMRSGEITSYLVSNQQVEVIDRCRAFSSDAYFECPARWRLTALLCSMQDQASSNKYPHRYRTKDTCIKQREV